MFRALCCVLLLSLVTGLELKAQLKDHWQSFKKAHLKSYSPNEEQKRQEIFKSNVEAVLKHNLKADLGEESYKLGINKFADMTEEEIERDYMGFTPSTDDNEETVDLKVESRDDYPATMDWRDSGYVTTPRDQKSCGSCWAFAAVAVVETHYGLAKKEHVLLSEQHLLDCAFNGGCKQGGNVLGGFYYIIGRGISGSDCYPYLAEKAEKCYHNTTCEVKAKITDHKRVKQGDEDALLRAVATVGPVAVAMYANPRQFSLYRGGLYNPETCSEPTNHAVVIVGYGTENGQPYWLIKNSWGPTWGEAGYFKLPRNAGNKCSVANEARYPVV